MTTTGGMWWVSLLRICRLRADPQDLPTSMALTALTLAAYYAADVAGALLTVPLARALAAAGADTLLLAALTVSALSFRGFGVRLRQTLTALAGSGAVLAFVTLGIQLLLENALGSLLSQEVVSTFVWVASLLWMFAVYGHILRHALGTPYAVGVAATGVYFILSVLITAPFLALSQTN